MRMRKTVRTMIYAMRKDIAAEIIVPGKVENGQTSAQGTVPECRWRTRHKILEFIS